MEQNQPETKYTKLDYSLKTAKERADFVASLPTEQLNNKKNLEFLANFIKFSFNSWANSYLNASEIITNILPDLLLFISGFI